MDGGQPRTIDQGAQGTASLALAVHLTPTWLSTLWDAFPDSEDTGVGVGEAETLGYSKSTHKSI